VLIKFDCRSNSSTVLLNGETGTGKETACAGIHNAVHVRAHVRSIELRRYSFRIGRKRIVGHGKRARSPVHSCRKRGRFELADRGTPFLDDRGTSVLTCNQSSYALCRNGSFGTLEVRKLSEVDVRLIAQPPDLQVMITQQQFREDLFYRLNVCREILLRERREDIPLLVHYFVLRLSAKCKKRIKSCPEEGGHEALVNHDWPGNIRELENFIERCVIFTQGEELKSYSRPAKEDG